VAKPKRSKYGNVRTTYGGVTYASKAEAAFAAMLDERVAAGTIEPYLRQVPIALPGGITWRVDFVVAADFDSQDQGTRLDAYEVKGVLTRDAAIKIKQARELYPWIRFSVWKRKGRNGWTEVIV
jgi:hypothetical protein